MAVVRGFPIDNRAQQQKASFCHKLPAGDPYVLYVVHEGGGAAMPAVMLITSTAAFPAVTASAGTVALPVGI